MAKKNDKMQASRFELKYFLTEDLAQRMRPFIQGYIEVDEYSACQPSQSYPTLSLYLDSDDLDTYWWTINGNKNRYKLRLRYYDERPDSPVFFEIKRRMNNVILKQRAGVRKDAVRLLLAGHMPDRDHLLRPEDLAQWAALQRFVELMLRLNAKPKLHVAYLREAYENPGNNAVRLTFDRAVESAPNHVGKLIEKSPEPHRVFDPNLVLELKFTDRFPNWFRELVETFNCMQAGAAKFAEGIYTRSENWIHRACPRKPPEVLVDDFLSGKGFPEPLKEAGKRK
jgi:hypothetical protein